MQLTNLKGFCFKVGGHVIERDILYGNTLIASHRYKIDSLWTSDNIERILVRISVQLNIVITVPDTIFM